MRIFHWEAKVGYKCIADGYLLAEDQDEAEIKLKYVPFHDTHEEVSVDVDDCGADGCEIDDNGIAIRWMD